MTAPAVKPKIKIRMKPNHTPQYYAILFADASSYINWLNDGYPVNAYTVALKDTVAQDIYTVNSIAYVPHVQKEMAIRRCKTPQVAHGYSYIIWAVSMDDFEVVN